MANGLWVFSQIPARRTLAADSSDPIQEGTAQSRQKANAKRSDYRQSERQDHRKRGPRGYDAGKRILGRKRHIIVDTLGLILAVVVHAGNIQDRDGALLVLERIRGYVPRLRLIWADGGYAGNLVETVKTLFHWTLEIVKRSDTGFVVLPKRWIVERTFSWLYRYRRLSKDYEQLPENSEAMILIAMINLMSRRLAHGYATQNF
jgi:putative transposase